jgi:hypothetical protein
VTAPAPERLTLTPLAEVGMRSILWLERPIWQRSAFQLLAGAKGSGKGTYLAGLAARVSKTANVVFVSSEDSAEIDLKPRLVAAGYVEKRCFLIQQHILLPDDVGELRRLALEVGGVGLLVIDPVANHLGDTKPSDDIKVRHAIAPLNGLADELDCLVIGVRHPGKDRSRGAVLSILGTVAWTDTPRAVVFIVGDDVDPALRHIQVVLGNRSLNGSGQTFRIEAVEVEGLAEPITIARALGQSQKDVEDLLKRTPRESGSDAAREMILDILEGEGEQNSDTLDARIAKETGLAAGTVRNLRVELGKEGLTRAVPVKDESGMVGSWSVARTGAPR